ncbi:hypothetical protein [Commensalibacter sp. Nvir]|uniref:hypothetical protein n=1 Tax=Commensalibacter sp. Nvir TaxID=3069817 RepID=UPI0030C8217B
MDSISTDSIEQAILSKNTLESKQNVFDNSGKGISLDGGRHETLKLKYANKQKSREQKIGWIGKCIGSEADKPSNIAFIVIILLIIFLFCIGFIFFAMWVILTLRQIHLLHYPRFGSLYLKIFSIIATIVTLCLGYIFGSVKK